MNDHRMGFPPTAENSKAVEDDRWMSQPPYPLGIPKRIYEENLRERMKAIPVYHTRGNMKFVNKNVTFSDYDGMRAMGFTPPEEKNFIKPIPERIIGEPVLTGKHLVARKATPDELEVYKDILYDAMRVSREPKRHPDAAYPNACLQSLNDMRMTPEQYFKHVKLQKAGQHQQQERAYQQYIQEQKYLQEMAMQITGVPAIYKGDHDVSISRRAQEIYASGASLPGQAAPCAAPRK